MTRIQRLDDAVVQRIAAGEVIKRPANAIKELLENSLDAGSTSITVTIQDGGYKTFIIQDNGHGILREDLPLLCERYATSKLKSLEDLRCLHSFGFRGEALASISHVARLSVSTKCPDNIVGYKVSYLDGKMIGEPIGTAANNGTLMTIQDLFYNNPVRSVTTNSKGEEYSRILNILQSYSIQWAGRCSITCRVQSKNPDLLTCLDNTAIDVVRMIYGEKTSSSLLSIDIPDRFNGLVSNAFHHQKRLVFILFINGRLVEHPRLKKALVALYSEVLPTQTFPFIYLSLTLPTEHLDVNVHPTKAEVIFLEEDNIINQVCESISKRISETGVVKNYIPKRLPKPDVPTPSVITTVRSVTTGTPTTKLYPFHQVHTDHKTRTLHSFQGFHPIKKAKTSDVNSEERTENSQNNNPFVIQSEKEPLQISPLHSQTLKQVQISILPVPTQKDTFQINPILTSLVKEATDEETPSLNEIFQKHVLVGPLDERRCFIQFETSLLLLDIPRILVESLYLLFITGKHAKTTVDIDIGFTIRSYIEANQDKPEIESLNTEELVHEMLAFINEKKEILSSLLGINIHGDRLISLPFTASHFPILLGSMLFHLVIEWKDEEEPDGIRHLIRLASEHIVNILVAEENQESLLSIIRNVSSSPPCLPSILSTNGAITKVATTHGLYKIFERC